MDNNSPSLVNQIASRTSGKVISFFESFIFGARWVIAPMYVGLVVSLFIYTFRFFAQLWEVCTQWRTLEEAKLMLSVIGFLDTLMCANLVVLVLVGSYSIFIRKLKLNEHDRPQWLDHLDSSTLKVKMGMSLIGISSIHLLKDFIDAEKVDREVTIRHVVIHIIFIISALALAQVGKMTHAPSSSNHP